MIIHVNVIFAVKFKSWELQVNNIHFTVNEIYKGK